MRSARIQRVELKGVTRLFGATAALKQVTLTLNAGDIYFLEGPNGAGKSTLLGIIGTLLTPTSGEIAYVPLGGVSAAVRAELGWVAHDSRCYRELSVRENVDLAAKLYGVDPSSGWERVAARTAIEALADRSVGTLSRGQRQRVALARALVHRPSLLLCDEPWTGLDVASGALLTQALLEERDGGALIVVVSHDPERADQLGATRLRIERGRLVTPELSSPAARP